jgi:N-acetylglucosamine-6-phosphate deacetylase
MGSILINNAQVVIEDKIKDKYSIYCNNGKIEKIIPYDKTRTFIADEVIDASGMYVAPGYIDMHIHGVKGLLVDNGKDELEGMCKILPQHGVTGFLPTICPKSSGVDDFLLISLLSQAKSKGTTILGFFLEGHYLALTGSISVISKDRSVERLLKIIEVSSPYKVVFGISPEVENIIELLPFMTKQGYPAFITHTAASFEQTEKAIEAGAVHATHFYNVFPYIGKEGSGIRTCGAVEAILANPQTSVDFILDGIHVNPAVIKMALACKGKDKVSLITDANVVAGMPPGSYIGLGGTEVDLLYEGGPALMGKKSRSPGGLAGSGLTMDKAVRNAVALLGVSIPQAIAMASSNPARVLGLQNHKGFIKEGYDADIVMLDKELNVIQCWVGGKCCFKSTRKLYPFS